MNFIPKIAARRAIDETLHGVADPAVVLDTERAALVAANEPGRVLWGGRAQHASEAIDTGMPALVELRKLAMTAEAAGPFAYRQLAFWTPRGVLCRPCAVQRLAHELGPAVYLVTWPGAVQAENNEAVRATPAPAMQARDAQAIGADAVAVRKLARRLQDKPDGAVPLSATLRVGAQPASGQAPGAADPSARDATLRAKLAHELRTPLAAIIALGEIMADQHLGPLPNERYRGYIRDIRDSARHALSVVDGLVAQSATENDKLDLSFTQVDLNDAVSLCVSSMEPLVAKAGLSVSTVLAAGMPNVIADLRSMKQILLNLLSNSVKYAGAGAKITVRTGFEAGGRVWVEVLDTGPGIAAETIARVFQPQRASQPGSGLGLPLSRQLAEANGARLEIAHEADTGACVRVVFSKDRAIPV